jgi:acetate---CoA ligase (ADP-forming)
VDDTRPSVALRDVRGTVEPRSIAVVGASPRFDTQTAETLRGPVPVWLVHPSRREAFGRPVHPSLADLPDLPDLVELKVGHTRVLDVMGDALELGVRSFVLSGLGAEAGPEAPALVARLVQLATTFDAAVVGPNCMGVARPGGGSTWNGTVPDTFRPGHVSVIGQSGSVAEGFMDGGPRVGYRCVVSTGGEAVRDAADFLAHFAADERTRVVAVYLETVRRPDAFAEALRRCARAGKPVVCAKVGRSAAAAQAALAHTGAMVGSARSFSAFLRHHGAIEVPDFTTMVETLEVLGRERWPKGRRLAAVSESGGECAMLADAADDAGLAFPPLPDALRQQLQTEFVNYTHPANPLDAWAVDAPEIVFSRSIELMARSGAYDVLLGQVDLSRYRGADEEVWCTLVAHALVEQTRGTDVFPAITSIHAESPPDSITRFAHDHDLALLRGTTTAMRALSATAGWQPRVAPEPRPSPRPLPVELRPGPLPEHDSAAVLEAYGVRFAPRRRAMSADDAARAAEALGYPVVVKVDGPAHKGAVGGVALDLRSPADVADAATRMGGRVLVARQLPPGVEVLCGMTRDPQYGPVVVVGLGGRVAEALALAAVALAPLDEDEAAALVERAPGLSAVATDAARAELARVAMALSQLAVDEPRVAAVDVNPLILDDDGAVAVDALVVVAQDG